MGQRSTFVKQHLIFFSLFSVALISQLSSQIYRRVTFVWLATRPALLLGNRYLRRSQTLSSDSRWRRPRDPRLRVFPGNFMYFVGYSKWLLLGSRLVAGEAHVHVHARTHVHVRRSSSESLLFCHLRCGSGSRLVHLRVPDPQHAARGARRRLRRRDGVQAGGPGPGSVPPAPLDPRDVRCAAAAARRGTGPASLSESSPPVSPGPAFNLFLRLCDFRLGPLVVNKFTSPGVKGHAGNPSSPSERSHGRGRGGGGTVPRPPLSVLLSTTRTPAEISTCFHFSCSE